MEIDGHSSPFHASIQGLQEYHQLIVCLLGEVSLVPREYAGGEGNSSGNKPQAVAPEAPAGVMARVARPGHSGCKNVTEGEPVALQLFKVIFLHPPSKRRVERRAIWFAVALYQNKPRRQSVEGQVRRWDRLISIAVASLKRTDQLTSRRKETTAILRAENWDPVGRQV